METCSRCGGQGIEEYEEDDSGRFVKDTCYHCGGTGFLSEEEIFNSQLEEVALTLATSYVRELRHSIDSDPDGDGWELMAAENMMNSWDYFRCKVWDKQEEFIIKLSDLPIEDKILLIAWNNYHD